MSRHRKVRVCQAARWAAGLAVCAGWAGCGSTSGVHPVVDLPDPVLPGTDVSTRGLGDIVSRGGTLVAVGDHGLVLISDDCGLNWRKGVTPIDEALTGLAFAADRLHGLAVSRGGAILATDDGGQNWTVAWRNPEGIAFNDVASDGADRAWVVGQHGLIVASRDGGKSWQVTGAPVGGSHLNRITRGRNGTLYVAGEHGVLLQSADAGDTWMRLASPTSRTLYGVMPMGTATLLGYGGDMAGRIFRSEDGGASWSTEQVERHFPLCDRRLAPGRLDPARRVWGLPAEPGRRTDISSSAAGAPGIGNSRNRGSP